MEQWNKGNKMIQQIGAREDPFEYLNMTETRLRTMETLASTHISWYTHKNPYGCWICDMFVLVQKVIDSFREFLGESDATVTTEPESLKGSSSNNSEIYDEEDAPASPGEDT